VSRQICTAVDRKEETRLAARLQQARRAYADLLLSLPEPWRTRVLLDDPDGPKLGHKWPLRRLEVAHRRVRECLEWPDCPPVLQEAALHKRQIDKTREAIIVQNLFLVIHLAGSFPPRGRPSPDLVQEGSIGLMMAVERFDWQLGYRFSTYAVWWIRQSMYRALADTRLIRLPSRIEKGMATLSRAVVELSHSLGRAPTKKELSAETGLPLKKVTELLNVPRDADPLESFDAEDDRSGFLRWLSDSPLRAIMERDLRAKVMKGLNALPHREQTIVRLHFGIGVDRTHTLQEIGSFLGLCRERVRQIERDAVRAIYETIFPT